MTSEKNNSASTSGESSCQSKWIWSAALAVLFTAIQIQTSLASGSLSLPPTYDDLAYLNDAVRRLEIFQSAGIWKLITDFCSQPPHSPLHSLLAFLGFSIFGVNHWAAIAMNALPLALLLRLFFFYSRSIHSGLSVAFSLFLLMVPYAGILIIDFRPDMLCAMLTAVGCIALVTRPWIGDVKHSALVGILFGSALLSKPAIFPLTLGCYGLAMILSSIPHYKTGSGWKILGKSWLWLSVSVLLVAGPFYLIAGSKVVGYIIRNMFSEGAEVWIVRMPLAEKLVYYLGGPGGRPIMGRWLYFISGSLLIYAFVLGAYRERRYATISTFLLIIFVYLVVSFTGNKTPFLGIAFSAFLIVATVAAWIASVSLVPTQWARLLTVAMLCIGMVLFKFPAAMLWGGNASSQIIEGRNRMANAIVDALVADQDLARRTVYQPVIAPYLNTDTLQFLIKLRNKPRPNWRAPYLSAKIEDHQAAIAESDYVILYSLNSTDVIPWLPSLRLRSETYEATQKLFSLVLKVPDQSGNGSVSLYRRK